MPETVLGTDLAKALGTPIDASDADNWPVADEPPPEVQGFAIVDDSGNPVVDDSGQDVVT